MKAIDLANRLVELVALFTKVHPTLPTPIKQEASMTGHILPTGKTRRPLQGVRRWLTVTTQEGMASVTIAQVTTMEVATT